MIAVSTLNARQSPQNDRRRSQRALLSVAVRISGSNPGGAAFSEDTTTVAVSAYGGSVLLKAAVRQGQRLKIRNQNTDEEIPCTAIDVNGGLNEIREVGVEFVAAAPRFWRVSFPPLDWSPRSAEAKRYGDARPSGENPPPLRVKK
jgi:hypothetical protein